MSAPVGTPPKVSKAPQNSVVTLLSSISCICGEPLEKVANNCSLALKIDAESSKALYRRAYARFAKKDYDGSKADLDQAQKHAPGDKAIATLLKKVRANEMVISWRFRSTVALRVPPPLPPKLQDYAVSPFDAYAISLSPLSA